MFYPLFIVNNEMYTLIRAYLNRALIPLKKLLKAKRLLFKKLLKEIKFYLILV